MLLSCGVYGYEYEKYLEGGHGSHREVMVVDMGNGYVKYIWAEPSGGKSLEYKEEIVDNEAPIERGVENVKKFFKEVLSPTVYAPSNIQNPMPGSIIWYDPKTGLPHYSDPSISPTTESPNSLSTGEKSNLGGINLKSIKLNYISVNANSSGGVDFNFLLKADKAEGNSPRIDPINSTLIEAIAFMTGLDVLDSKFWVNLSPWEQDRIIDEQLRKSDVGRIMLEADFQMKKDFSNYENPCANETGKAFWKLLEIKQEALTQQCMKKFPGEIKDINNVMFIPPTGRWIAPDKIYCYANGTQIYIINATLKINTEPEINHTLFQVVNQDIGSLSNGCLEELNKSAKEFCEYWKEQEDRMIQPYVVSDVNNGGKYEDLRDVYVALALAQWYKSKVPPSMDVFRDRLDSPNSTLLISQRFWSPNEIWNKYVFSFKNGEYTCWRNNTTTKAAIGEGGIKFYNIRDHFVENKDQLVENKDQLVENKEMPAAIQDQVNRAIMYGFINEEKNTLFGNRIHIDVKQDSPILGSGSVSSPRPEGPNDKSDNLTSLHKEKTMGISPAIDEGNASRINCPDGWMGPDEKGKCWKLQITNKN